MLLPPALAPAVLTTARLTLAPHTSADLAEMAALFGDPQVMDPIGAPVATREQSWQRLLRYIGHWSVLGFGHWVVRDEAGLFVGEVGLMDARRATQPDCAGAVEAGWAFTASSQGRGFAAEACTAMLDWADARGIARTICLIAPTNARSLRLAGRLGYTRWADGLYGDRPTVMLERPSSVLPRRGEVAAAG